MPVFPFTTNIDDSALKELYMDYPFNWTLNLALYQMGDAGVLADVHQYRSSYLRLQYMRRENAHLTHMLLMIQKEQEVHNEEINNFVNDIISIRECLTDARVMSRLVPAYRQLAVQSTIPNLSPPSIRAIRRLLQRDKYALCQFISPQEAHKEESCDCLTR